MMKRCQCRECQTRIECAEILRKLHWQYTNEEARRLALEAIGAILDQGHFLSPDGRRRLNVNEEDT